jgi:hypothetical protein
MNPKVNADMVKPITGMSPLLSINIETQVVRMATIIASAEKI